MAKQNDGQMNTIIGKGSRLEGTCDISNSLRIDGGIKGKLSVGDSLTVGKDGVIEAEIKTKKATIAGKVIGSIDASERIVLESGAIFKGDLKTKFLVIEEGAAFIGNCQSGNEAQNLSLAKKAPAPKKEEQESNKTETKLPV